MKVRYNKGMGYPVEISDGKTATCISLDTAKKLQANLSAVIEQAENTQEEELSEFEKELEGFYNHHLQVCTYDNQGTVEDSLHDGASKLLAIARKKLEQEIKAEALKDLPRWIPNKFDKHNFETCKAYLDTPRYLCYEDKMIDVSELVEKLPGFKED